MLPPPDDTTYVWEFTEHPGDKSSMLRQRLGAFNVERARIDQSQDLAIFLSDQQGELMAGIVGWIWGECLEIAFLWVHAVLRGQGYGTRLMERLEAEARTRSCSVSVLDTFSFQAPAFYTKLGYEIFGSVAGYPNGVQKLFLRKQLRAASTPDVGAATQRVPGPPNLPASCKRSTELGERSTLMTASQTGNRFLNPPALPQPFGYTHVVEARPGRTVYISGQIALDSAGKLVGSDDLQAQATQVFANLDAALAAVGATFQDVVKLTYFLLDITQIAVVRAVRDRYVNTQQPPASSAVEVRRLFRDDLLLEIEAIAVIPE